MYGTGHRVFLYGILSCFADRIYQPFCDLCAYVSAMNYLNLRGKEREVT